VTAFLKKEPGVFEALSADAVALVMAHAFDGNFRELSNFVARIPRGAEAGSVGVAACRRALEQVSLSGPRLSGPHDMSPPPPTPPGEGAEGRGGTGTGSGGTGTGGTGTGTGGRGTGGTGTGGTGTGGTSAGGTGPWADLAAAAMRAFSDDNAKTAETWDDVKAYIEKYLKPMLFAHLSHADSDPAARGNVQLLADRLDSDRGTAAKQLARWLERFARAT
jgi:DNA-binding NtrC family response regulator